MKERTGHTRFLALGVVFEGFLVVIAIAIGWFFQIDVIRRLHFAAIPAVVAFNRFADQVGRLEVRYDAFMEEFSSILQRHATARKHPGEV